MNKTQKEKTLKPKKSKKLAIEPTTLSSNHYAPQGGSTITSSHYTSQGDHPEDRIFRDKEYASRLQTHIDNVFESLSKDLRLNKNGEDWLFDFFYNENSDADFEEFLQNRGINYNDIIK